MIRPPLIVALCAVCWMGFSCREEANFGGFKTSRSSASEDGGTQSITIDLGITTTKSTVITYRVGGNAALDGDYRLTTLTNYFSAVLTVTVPAGESQAIITFEIIDDVQIESEDEFIFFDITSISDATIAGNIRQTSCVFQILDNDNALSPDLQVDLTWNLGDGVRINASNFDMYLATSIIRDTSGVVTEFQAVDGKASTNVTGFESLTIDTVLPDQQYYVIIKYISGDNPAILTVQLNSNQVSRIASGRVTSASLGRLLYLGPIIKNGNSFDLN